MKEDWKYAFLVSGTLSVMMGGVTVRHKWYASNWDTLIKVKIKTVFILVVGRV